MSGRGTGRAFDAGDAEAVGRRAKAIAKEQARRAAGLRYVLADRRGRDWLWSLLEHCRIYETSFTGDSATFFNEGMRNVGLKVMTQIAAADPEALVTMMTENRADERDDAEQ